VVVHIAPFGTALQPAMGVIHPSAHIRPMYPTIGVSLLIEDVGHYLSELCFLSLTPAA
jgi:hypothetical protein